MERVFVETVYFGMFWVGRASFDGVRSRMRIIAYGEEEVKSKLKMLDPYLSVVGLEIREWPRRRCGDVQISAHVEAWCDKRLCGSRRRSHWVTN